MSIAAAFRAAGVPTAVANAEAPRAERAMLEAGITSQSRARFFLAQVLHESGRLVYFEELASGAAYEGRADLGNVHPGDGVRYKGRGPIQLTGRANYRAAGKSLGLPLEDNPQLASHHDVGWRIAAWYWRTRGLNGLADAGDFIGVTRRINGGTNGLADRQACLHMVSTVDCRPDRYRGLTAGERRACIAYDHLVGEKGTRVRRKALRKDLRRRRKAIFAAAQADGWDKYNRRFRYNMMRSRTT